MTKIDHRHENSGRFPFTEAKAGSRQTLILKRLTNGWSQEYVADKIGCSQELYSLMEHGKRDGKRYWSSLSILFGIPSEELMKTDNSEPDWSFLRGDVNGANTNVNA